jgi:hypothetical protein
MIMAFNRKPLWGAKAHCWPFALGGLAFGMAYAMLILQIINTLHK